MHTQPSGPTDARRLVVRAAAPPRTCCCCGEGSLLLPRDCAAENVGQRPVKASDDTPLGGRDSSQDEERHLLPQGPRAEPCRSLY
eukprot:1161681-Pelagomonas_calceolata.AAC.10